jgi:5-methyltetrahydropteroyltriglutamate--homocysteine methyltransferase
MDAIAVLEAGRANRRTVTLLRTEDEDVSHGSPAGRLTGRPNGTRRGITVTPVLEAHTDVVGSLLRPPELLEARERLEHGEIEEDEFRSVEDRAVDAALRLQEDAGLDVVTDGEMRRLSFQSQMTAAVEGFGDWDLDAFLWGEWHSDELGDLVVERPPIAVVGKLRRKRFLSVDELVYARSRTDRVLKVTLPSPSLFANFWEPDRSAGAYATPEEFLGDVAEILREEVDELVRVGATYIQLDAPQYPLLVDERYREFYERRGWPADRWLDLGVELDNHVIGNHPGVTFGIHLCRGNQASRWLVSGGYEWLAAKLFPKVHAERLLLEYDDARSGGFEPLGEVPEDKTAVLGLVTTKSGRRETVDELAGRIRDAARFLPLERLALSPQCGFATSILGNALTLEEEAAKLRTIAQTAEAVWRCR